MVKPIPAFVSKRVPLYYQLENLLREKIFSGAFAPGDRLPTESELIRQFGVSRITVRQALSALVEDGVIERRRGRGTYVVERKIELRPVQEQAQLTGSLDEIIALGLASPVKVIEINRIEASLHEAELLGLQAGEMVYRIKRMRFDSTRPKSLILNYLPSEIGARFTREELTAGSLLQMIEAKFGLRLKDARQHLTARLADPYVAGLLDVRIGSPLLSIERTVYTDEGRPIEHVQVLSRTDLSGYTVHLIRDDDQKSRKTRSQKR